MLQRAEKQLLVSAEGKFFMMEKATLVRSNWSGRQVWSWESNSYFKSSQVSRLSESHPQTAKVWTRVTDESLSGILQKPQRKEWCSKIWN